MRYSTHQSSGFAQDFTFEEKNLRDAKEEAISLLGKQVNFKLFAWGCNIPCATMQDGRWI